MKLEPLMGMSGAKFGLFGIRCCTIPRHIQLTPILYKTCLYPAHNDPFRLNEAQRLLLCRLRLKCDGTRAETRFRLLAKRTSPFKSAGASVQSTTGSRGVRISGINAGYTMLRGSVRGAGYTLHSPVSPSLPLPCVTVCHHISAGLYNLL